MFTVGILLTNINGGGTLRHARELATAWINDYRGILILVIDNLVQISVYQNGSLKSTGYIHKNGEYLIRILKKYNIRILHVEHLLNATPFFLQLHRKLRIPLVVTLHDYYMICPFIKLTTENNCYCQEKGDANCNICLQQRGFYSLTLNHYITDINEWRNFWKTYLSEAQLVLVPSVDAQNRLQRYYPELNIQVAEDPEVIQYRSEQRQIGLIGNLSIAKGAGKVKECLQYCLKYKINLHFVLFGTLDGIELTEDEKRYITILGTYKESEIYSLISQYFIDFFWFPGVLPETYSYTLSIPIRLRIPCISTDLGAIASRIHEHHWGSTYSWDADASKIITELIKFPYEEFYNPAFKITNTTFGTIESYYGDVLKKVPTEKANRFSTENVIIPNVFSHINGVLTRDEFTLLWQSASLLQKVILLRHVDYHWLKNVLKQKGIKYFYKKLKEKL